MIDDWDGERVIPRTTQDRKARKDHKACYECGRLIERGETYRYETWVEHGLGYGSAKTCSHCMVAREWLYEECGGWIGSTVREDVTEHFKNDPKHYGLGVGRLAAGMKMRWRYHGKLMRLPRLPPTTHDKKPDIKPHDQFSWETGNGNTRVS